MSNDICPTTDLHVDECDCSRHRPAAPREPGLYPDLDESVYHADKNSLSSSGARALLEVAPAQWKWERDNPTATSTEYFDLGTAVHTLVLGTGAPVVEIEADDWRAKASKEARAAVWARGAVPLLSSDYATVRAMADAVRSHDLAATLFSDGAAEQSLYYHDEPTGVMLRARPDWLPALDGRLIMCDLKTAETADPKAFSTSAARYGYAAQAAWYRAAAVALGLDPNPAFVFIVVAKRPPHLVSVIELDVDAIEYGEARNRRAIDLYAQCVESGEWPGYEGHVHRVTLPRWAFAAEEWR